jgi:hypothetical protein
MNELVRQKLCEIINRYGRSLCDDPRRCEALLRDYCGQHPREISLLINSMKEGIIADLLVSQNSTPPAILLARLAERLQQNLYLSEEAARWTVESWALALGIIPKIAEKTETYQIEKPAKSSLTPTTIQSSATPTANFQKSQKSPEYSAVPVVNPPSVKSSKSVPNTARKSANLIVYLGLILTGMGLAIFFGISKLLFPPAPQPISSVTPTPLPSAADTPSPNPVNPLNLSPIEFVKEYYVGINNKNYGKTWNQLTSAKQRESGGWESYLQWWNSVREVRVDNISLFSQSDDTALLKGDFSFSMNSGKTATENNKRIYLIRDKHSQTWLISDILSFNSLTEEEYPTSQCGDTSVTSPFYRVYISDAGSFDKIKVNFCKDARKTGDKIQVAAFDEYQDAQKFKEFLELHFNQVEIEKRIW